MDLSIVVNGMTFPNPFLLGSGPPGTNARVIANRDADGAERWRRITASIGEVATWCAFGKLRSKLPAMYWM